MITTYTKRGHCPFTVELECAKLPDILHLRKMMQRACDTAESPGDCLFFDSIVKQLETCLPASDHLNEASPLPGENESLTDYRDRVAKTRMSAENVNTDPTVLHEQVTEKPLSFAEEVAEALQDVEGHHICSEECFATSFEYVVNECLLSDGEVVDTSKPFSCEGMAEEYKRLVDCKSKSKSKVYYEVVPVNTDSKGEE